MRDAASMQPLCRYNEDISVPHMCLISLNGGKWFQVWKVVYSELFCCVETADVFIVEVGQAETSVA